MKIYELITKKVLRATKNFWLIQDNDKILVWFSWWKDSYTLLKVLNDIKKYKSFNFDVIWVYVRPWNKLIKDHSVKIEKIFNSIWVDYIIKDLNIPAWSRLQQWLDELKTCQWCTYSRRMTLFKLAEQIWWTKIALWHHMDDMVDTLMLNVIKNSYLKLMPVKNVMKTWNLTIIRPLAYVREYEVINYITQDWFKPFVNTCPLSDKSKRIWMRNIVDDIELKEPKFVENLFHSYVKVLWWVDDGDSFNS
jgi:tRNA(Ile)-lysidine synthase TilS/MesJ